MCKVVNANIKADMNKNKIAIVVAYFGKFPNYFPLWLKSCGSNPNIDVIIVTDQKVDVSYANIFVKELELSDLQERATKVLGFEAALNHPYKCCDYKPLYGVLFADFLEGYDYWGHCDVDLIFGDLQHFFEKYDLYSYDRFGVLGHLSLYKNNDLMNNSYKTPDEVVDYKKVYTTDDNCIFDELGGVYKIHKKLNLKIFVKRIFVDIATIYKRYRLIECYDLDTRPINYPIQTFCWENGKTYHIYWSDGRIHKQEYIYIHFQKRPNYKIQTELLTSEVFYISNQGFSVCYKDNLTSGDILKMNPYKGRLYEAIEGRYNLFSRRVKNYLKRALSHK